MLAMPLQILEEAHATVGNFAATVNWRVVERLPVQERQDKRTPERVQARGQAVLPLETLSLAGLMHPHWIRKLTLNSLEELCHGALGPGLCLAQQATLCWRNSSSRLNLGFRRSGSCLPCCAFESTGQISTKPKTNMRGLDLRGLDSPGGSRADLWQHGSVLCWTQSDTSQ